MLSVRALVGSIALAAAAFANAAPPPNPEPLDKLIVRGCGFVKFAFVARVASLQPEVPKAGEPCAGPDGVRQTARIEIIDLIKGDTRAAPRTLWGCKRVPNMSDQLGVDLEEGKAYLVLMDWDGAPGRELLRFPELTYEGDVNKYTDKAFRQYLEIARNACRPQEGKKEGSR